MSHNLFLLISKYCDDNSEKVKKKMKDYDSQKWLKSAELSSFVQMRLAFLVN